MTRMSDMPGRAARRRTRAAGARRGAADAPAGRAGAARAGPPGRGRHRARGARRAAPRRRRRRPARAAAPARGGHRRARQRRRPGLDRPRRRARAAPASPSPTTSPCAAWPSGWPPSVGAGSTTRRPTSTSGSPTAPASTRCSRRCRGPGTVLSLRVPRQRVFTMDELVTAGAVPPAGVGAPGVRGPATAGVADQRRHGLGQDDAAERPALDGRRRGAAGAGRGRLRAAPRARARRGAGGAPGQHRGRRRGHPAHAGPAGAADAARPARRRRGPRRPRWSTCSPR